MPDFNVRSDSVNVEQIMEQIRARIREKRGVDYTEQQIRELATVKLETFLDPRGVRSDLLDQFKALPKYEPPDLPNYAFEDATLFESHRAAIRWVRKLLMPLLKLLFNPNPLIQALHIQAQLNAMNLERENQREMSRRAMDQLYYELVHNLVIETTRTGIAVKNLKMRVESISSRLEFNERRARALEGVVVYKPSETVEPPAPQVQVQRQAPPPQRQYAPPSQPQQRHTPPQRSYSAPEPAPASTPAVSAAPEAIPAQPTNGPGTQAPGQGSGVPGEGPGQRSRRRRRRRGRRGGGAAAAVMGAPGSQPPPQTGDGSASVDAVEEMDAMDRLDDDGGPESDETHAAAVEHVEQAAIADAHADTPVVEPRVEPPVVTPPAPHVDPPTAPPAPAIEPPPPAEPTTATTPPSPDHADPDPQ